MRTEIHFVDGKSAVYDDDSDVKTSDHGVEITQGEGAAAIRILFPWNRIEKITQMGPEIAATYRI